MKPLRILLADDHEVVRKGLRTLLEGDPQMEVVGEARNGVEACEKARALRPDVLVLDVSMPELSGAEATEQVCRECPGVRVLALTMHDDQGYLTRLLEAGASGYVLKRSSGEELLRAIRTVADVGTYVDPVLSGRVLRRNAGAPGSGTPESSEKLSDREEEVLRKIAWGHGNKEIASQLGISTKTVETYKVRIAEKLGLTSRREIVRYALQRGWLSLEE
jgi:two-component system, NarL family, response regulator NreC